MRGSRGRASAPRGRGAAARGRGSAPPPAATHADPVKDAKETEDVHHAFSTDENSSPIQRLQAVLLSQSPAFMELNAWYKDQPSLYFSELLMLLHSVDVPRNVKINALLVGFENKDSTMLNLLLSDTVNFGLPEVLAAAHALDAERRVRSVQKKITAISSAPDVVQAIADGLEDDTGDKRKRMSDVSRKVRRNLASLAKFKAELIIRRGERVAGLKASLSGHNCAFFCRWAEQLESEELSHFLLEFGLDLWRGFADIVHLNPNRMKLDCFLPYAFNSKHPLPADLQFMVDLKEKTATGIKPLLKDIVAKRVPYGYLKRLFPVGSWDDATKKAVAEYISLTTLLWWIEELRCPAVEKVIQERLAGGEAPSFGYGKLMERLMYCSSQRSEVLSSLIPVAQQSISQYTMPLRTPMAVLGDCSGSMQVAVRTSSIIVSLMAALGKAHLLFFNDTCVEPPFVPRTIKEVLICAEEVEAKNATSPAAALEQLYFKQVVVETLVVVTDERENDPGPMSGLYFHQLLAKYKKELSPNLDTVLVSFLGPTEAGEMATKLTESKIPFLQCRLNGNRPDLTKLDMLLGKLSMDTPMHVVAAKALSFLVTTNRRAVKDVADVTFDFRRDSTATVLRLLESCVRVATSEQFDDLRTLLLEFFGSLPSNDFVVRAMDRTKALVDVEEAKRWVDSEWGIGFTHCVQGAVGADRDTDVLIRESFKIGTLSRLPQEVLGHTLGYLPRRSIDDMSAAAPTLARMCHEARFDSKFCEEKGEFDDQLDNIRAMGILEMFDEESVLETLKMTKGNVEYAVALLFGEGRDGRGKGRSKK